MIIDKKRLERQQLSGDKWFDAYKRGIIDHATGTGKTYTAILIIKRLFRLFEDEFHNIVIIVHSEALVKQWKEVLAEHFNKTEQRSINVFSVNEIIINKIKITTDTVIFDEIHQYYSSENFKVIDGTYIKYNNALGLTATVKDSKNRHKKVLAILPVIDIITEEEAIKEGYISSFIEFNLSVTFTEKEKEEYKEHTAVINRTLNKFGREGLDLATKCLQGGEHNNGKKYPATHFVYGWASHNGWHNNLNLDNPHDRQTNDIWNPHKIFGYAKNAMNAIRLRKNLIYNCENKVTVCKEITEKLKDLKTIIFSQSTSFADKLNLTLNGREGKHSVVYHSNLQTVMLPSPKTNKLIKFGKTRLKRMAIERIKSGKSRIICTASSLDTGFDVQSMQLGITASGTSNFVKYAQRGGRVKRIDMFNTLKKAMLINLYVKDTKDEVWLKKRQSQVKHTIYNIDSIKDISFTPINNEEFTLNDL